MDYDQLIEDAAQAKQRLRSAIRAAEAEARIWVRQQTESEQSDLDAAVRLAYDAGVSKSILSEKTGESRVTTNQRLSRTSGFAAPVRGEAKPKVGAEPEVSKFSLDAEASRLVVKDGEDEASFEFIFDEVAEAYLFTNAMGSIALGLALEDVYDGELYEEANKWLKATQSN